MRLLFKLKGNSKAGVRFTAITNKENKIVEWGPVMGDMVKPYKPIPYWVFRRMANNYGYKLSREITE